MTDGQKFISMREGGKKLAYIKNELQNKIGEGVSAWEIEELANKLIDKSGGTASFKKVANYSWATCVNVNEGVVHGIPKKEVIFKKGDLVSVDVGLLYKGFHTDTSISVGISLDKKLTEFLNVGKSALEKAISKTCLGNRIYDISKEIEATLKSIGARPVESLVGHGIGRQLHMDPQIPGIARGAYNDSPAVIEGNAYAIEVIYTMGEPNIVRENDGWTISMADGKISALYEDTVFVTKSGPVILTRL